MGIFVTIAIIVFVPVCIVLTLIILLQDSKGEGLSSSAFGASEMQSVLGGHGAATFLSKLTTWVAIGFMVISLFLMRFYGERQSNTLEPLNKEAEQVQQTEDRGASDEVTENTEEDTKANGTSTEENSQDTQEATNDDSTKGELAPEVETE